MALVAFPMDKPPDAITLSDGTWMVMDELHGRDYRIVMAMNASSVGPGAIDSLLELIEKRTISASVPDVLDLRLSLLMELVQKWMGATEEEALPPTNAPDSLKPSQPRRSTIRASQRKSR